MTCRRDLSQLSEPHMREHYAEFWRACELKPGCVPLPGLIQRLLATWKVLWEHQELSRAKPHPPPKSIAPEDYENTALIELDSNEWPAKRNILLNR
jgi:hypothetical protein